MSNEDSQPESEEDRATRLRQIEAIQAAAGAWSDEDCPDLARFASSSDWVSYIRSLDHERNEQLIARHLDLPDEDPTS